MSKSRLILSFALALICLSAGAQGSVERSSGLKLRGRSGSGGSTMIMTPKGSQADVIMNDKYTDEQLKEFNERMKEREWASEDTAWKRVCEMDTAEAYQQYIARFPGGEHRAEASKRFVDRQVRDIMEGAHNEMPGMKRVKEDDDSPTSTVVITNCTGYILTVLYSGLESGSVSIAPDRTASFTVTNDSYKIAASVSKSSVKPFAGIGELAGGTYEVSFYVVSGPYQDNGGPGWIHRY